MDAIILFGMGNLPPKERTAEIRHFSSKLFCQACAFAYDERHGIEVHHMCRATGQLRPYRQTRCEKYKRNKTRMKTNRQIKRDEVAAFAYKLYLSYLDKGYSNQQAIDAARSNRRVLVTDRTMRNYIKLMQEAEQ